MVFTWKGAEPLYTDDCQQDASFGPDFRLFEMAPAHGCIKPTYQKKAVQILVFAIGCRENKTSAQEPRGWWVRQLFGVSAQVIVNQT
jgi:hypothetical protein